MDRFILVGFIWANTKTTTKGTGTFVVAPANISICNS